VELLRRGGAQQQTLDRLVLQRPGDRQLGGAAAQLLGEGGKVTEAVAVAAPLLNPVLAPTALRRKSGLQI